METCLYRYVDQRRGILEIPAKVKKQHEDGRRDLEVQFPERRVAEIVERVRPYDPAQAAGPHDKLCPRWRPLRERRDRDEDAGEDTLDGLEGLTRAELLEHARDLGLTGLSNAAKDEVLVAIRRAEAAI